MSQRASSVFAVAADKLYFNSFLAPHSWFAAPPNGGDSGEKSPRIKVAIRSEQWTRGWKDPQTCCTEKKEMFEDFLSFQLADLMDHSMERRHLFSLEACWSEPRALSSLTHTDQPIPRNLAALT